MIEANLEAFYNFVELLTDNPLNSLPRTKPPPYMSHPPHPRDVDGRKCALKCCNTPIGVEEDGVRVATPHKRLTKVPGGEAGRSALHVAWDKKSPTAYFHAKCWGSLLVRSGLSRFALDASRGGPQAIRAGAPPRLPAERGVLSPTPSPPKTRP